MRKEEKSKEKTIDWTNRIFIGVISGIMGVSIITVVAILIICLWDKNGTAEELAIKVEATLLASGLSIIGIAISVWAGLNIMNAIEKKEVDQIRNNMKDTHNDIQKLQDDVDDISEQVRIDVSELERMQKERKGMYKGFFLQELLYTSQDAMSRYFYKCFSEIEIHDTGVYAELVIIEQYFSQVYSQYTGSETIKQLILKRANEGLSCIARLLEEPLKDSIDLIEIKNVLYKYLFFRQSEFYFLKGYLLSEVEKYEAFRRVIKEYEKVTECFGIFLPDYTGDNAEVDIVYEGDDKDLQIAVYFLNTIGECYSKLSEDLSLIDKRNKAKVRITKEELGDYSCRAIFYLELAVHWNEKLDSREVYHRNLGCAYERAERLFEKYGCYSEKIIFNYKKAFELVVSNKNEKMGRVQNVYHTLLSYYERYLKISFGYKINDKKIFNNNEAMEVVLERCKKNISNKLREYIVEYQEISAIASTDNARFGLQRTLNGLAWTWIVTLLLCEDKVIMSKYPKGIDCYMEKIRENILALNVMGIDDDYCKELKSRYNALCIYLGAR